MADTRPLFISRRSLMATGLATVALPAAALAAQAPVLPILGDSITAGYGLPQAASLPIQLQAAMEKIGVPCLVRGAGVSGDTTANGAGRMDFSIRGDTQVVVVELGGNDILQ